jgi:hypothetical protein
MTRQPATSSDEIGHNALDHAPFRMTLFSRLFSAALLVLSVTAVDSTDAAAPPEFVSTDRVTVRLVSEHGLPPRGARSTAVG